MPLKLNKKVNITDVIESVKINSFSVDIDKKEIYVAYSELNAMGNVLAEKSISIVEPDFSQTITDASATAGTDIYTPLKNSLYNQMQLESPDLLGVVS